MRRDPDACLPPGIEREPLPLVPAGAPRGSGDAAAADRTRIEDGWQPRFVADRARAEEAMRLYRELGFEVAADPVAPETLPGGCGGCPLPQGLGFRMIYTRPRSPATHAGGPNDVAVPEPGEAHA